MSQTINWQWARGGGGNGSDVGHDISFDFKRNFVYSLGESSSSITIGSQTLTGSGSFITKHDTAGNLIWAKRFGSGIRKIQCDTISGAIYLSYGTAGYLTKMDENGNVLWTKSAWSIIPNPGGALMYFNDMLVLADGNIIVSGYFEHLNDTLVIDGNKIYGFADCLLLKINPNGQILLGKLVGNSHAYQELNGLDKTRAFLIERDNQDNIYVGYNFKWSGIGAFNDCGRTLDNSSFVSFTAVKFNSNLQQLQQYCNTPFGSGSNCQGLVVHIDRQYSFMKRDINGDIYTAFNYSYYGQNCLGCGIGGCGGSGYSVKKFVTGNQPQEAAFGGSGNLPKGQLVAYNGLLQFFDTTTNKITLYDFKEDDTLATLPTNFKITNAATMGSTRRTFVTGFYNNNVTVGPDVLPTLPGQNFLVAAEQINCPASISVTPTSVNICEGDSVYLTATAGFTYLWNTGERTRSIVVKNPGTYIVTGILGGCPNVVSNIVTVNVNPLPPIPVISASGPTSFCSPGSVTLNAPAGYASYTWSNSINHSSSITITQTSDVSVSVYNASGCGTRSAPVSVISNPLPPVPVITVNGSTSICQGDSTKLVAPAGYNYLWSTGETTQQIIVRNSGSYSVTISSPLNCGPSQTSLPKIITVNPLPIPAITPSGPTSFCSGGSVTLTTIPANNYSWYNGITSISGGQSLIATTNGVYTVEVRDANGCKATSPAIVVSAATPPGSVGITANGPTTFCFGDSVILTASSGYNYSWNNGATSQQIIVKNAGIYSVSLSNSCGSANATITISVNRPVISASGPTCFLPGGSVTLTSSTALNYLWSNGATTQSITVNNPGNYAVIGSYFNCTATSQPVVISSNNLSAPVLPTPNDVCPGNTLTLSAPPGYTYLWNTGATSQNLTLSGTGGIYYVTIFDSNGCSARSNEALVNFLPASPVPIITPSGPTTFCSGGSVTLNASGSGNIGNFYTWSTGETGLNIMVSTPGIYTVTAPGILNCPITSLPVTITVLPAPPIPTISASGSTTLCAGENVILTSSSSSNNLWSTGATAQSITVNTTGNYSVVVTSANGCTSTSATTAVTVNSLPPTPIITTNGPTSFCSGGSVTLSAPAGYTYLWSNGATSQSIIVNTSGNYSVTITNASGCSNTSVATTVSVVPFPATPTITASGPTTFCTGGSVTLSAPPGFSWLWSDGSSTQSINVTAGGNYTVTVINGTGCSSTSVPTTVTVNPLPNPPTISASGPTTFCIGGSVTLTAPPGFTYLWNTGSTSQSINVNTSGNYSVTVTNGNGCSSTSLPETVTVNPLPAVPVITTSGPTTFCQNSFVTLSAPAGFTYLWSTGATTQSIPVSNSGNYSVTVTNLNGCSATSAATTVTVNPLPAVPVITAGGPTTFCQGGSVTLSAPAGFTYLWNTSATTQSINVNTSGNYSVSVTNANNCSAVSAITTVTVNPLPPVPVITQNGNVLTSTAATTYQWYFNGAIIPGAIAQSYTYSTGGDYTVTVTNAQGCSSTSQIYTAMRNEFVLLNGNERFFMNLFPNPVTSGQLTIVYELEQPHKVAIRLINEQGRSIPVQSETARTAGRYSVNANAIAERIWTGVYFIEFTIDGRKVMTRKLIRF